MLWPTGKEDRARHHLRGPLISWARVASPEVCEWEAALFELLLLLVGGQGWVLVRYRGARGRGMTAMSQGQHRRPGGGGKGDGGGGCCI